MQLLVSMKRRAQTILLHVYTLPSETLRRHVPCVPVTNRQADRQKWGKEVVAGNWFSIPRPLGKVPGNLALFKWLRSHYWISNCTDLFHLSKTTEFQVEVSLFSSPISLDFPKITTAHRSYDLHKPPISVTLRYSQSVSKLNAQPLHVEGQQTENEALQSASPLSPIRTPHRPIIFPPLILKYTHFTYPTYSMGTLSGLLTFDWLAAWL